MPMRLRFAIHGHRNNRIFHLVAIDKRQRRDGKPAELLGIYNPNLKPDQNKKTIEWSVDRIRYWLHVGAVPSKSVVRLLELGHILMPGHPYEDQAALRGRAKNDFNSETTPPPAVEATPAPQTT
ncbi:hypothetical protein AMATHDRAFT_3639 [Amanita thiersii Skay4041]|uniref:Ribosomal protein S16 n=1 Tax=Amanita thiersii Skay4041 TaxID=703135 RepID=A0A2A9NSZ6_9AGAR|nr:hypothetical protein AMATHDRAFT_3639 [Amanita thiersii Skay4041]